MTTILNSDFFKLWRNIGFRLLPIATIICTVVTACFMLFVQSGATVEGEVFTAVDVFGFIPVGSLGAYALTTISNLYGFIVVVFSGLFISTEFAQGTIRNALCAGASRSKVYLSKLAVNAVMLILCMSVSTLTFIASFTALYGFGDPAGFITNTVLVLGMQVLYHLVYAAIGCLLAFLVPNIAFSVGVGLVFVGLQGVLVEICSAFDVLNPLAPFIPHYYIMRLTENFHDAAFLAHGAAVSIIFVLATVVIGCLLFKRQDIK
ncbi:MAG: ABC transporter permease [Candidatus Margulisbacteria bacterium]|jgi:ABC-2 type transport system permease protein|nr:ABC transporter permease [Candidatus Margulisiibacteriota bacterium]